jgi:hypothetical protein
MKMEGVCSSEPPANSNRVTRCHIQEDKTLVIATAVRNSNFIHRNTAASSGYETLRPMHRRGLLIMPSFYVLDANNAHQLESYHYDGEEQKPWSLFLWCKWVDRLSAQNNSNCCRAFAVVFNVTKIWIIYFIQSVTWNKDDLWAITGLW